MAMNEAFKRRSYKLVPPDGGYGYVIVVAVSLNLVTATMFYVCFAVIFKDFLIKLGMGTTSISLVTAVRALSVALSGFLTGPLLKVMSRRKLAFIGSIFFNSGVFGTVFVETQAQFILCQGFLQVKDSTRPGYVAYSKTFGLGFLYNVSCTLINDYFLEKRLLTTSIMNTLAAAATMVAPMIVSWSMAEYGFRGTIIIISAVGIQNFVGSALLQPVAWHMKKVPVGQVQEKEVFLLASKGDRTVSQTRRVKLNDVGSGSGFREDETNKSTENVATTWKNIMDWSAIKKYMRTCTCYVLPAAVFADILFIYNLAQSLYALQWNDEQVQWSFALIAFGDLATRVLFIFSSTWLKILGCRIIYVIGLLIAIATKLAMLWVRGYIATLAVLAVMGISRCIIVVILPLVVADCVQPEQFPSAIGICFMLYGLICIVLGPIIGEIRDRTGSYMIMFIILVVIFSVITVALSIEILRDYTSRNKKGKTEEEPVPMRRQMRSMSICV